VTASVNALTEVVFLNRPPWLSINEAVAGPAALPRITEAGNWPNRLGAHFENALQKICVVVMVKEL
jgi:hypothetical protein